MSSTTATGDEFRDEVGRLLKAAGYDVQSEVRVGSKKADLYYEERRRGKKWRVAVETKAYQDALTRNALSAIDNSYSDAFDDNDIDELLVVSLKPITAADANGFLNRKSRLSHRTIADLQIDLLDFDPVLRYFRATHERSGLEEYYILPRATDGRDMVALIEDWLGNDDPNPVAIIAGYGMGKTSFATHVTYKLASAIEAGDRQTRIPVLVNMGGLSREQGVEGLIGTALSGTHPSVRGYAFPLFDLLNDAGRFLVILDGFDEMKHMMTISEFRNTFQEINKLCTGRAKVMILGRPTAFMSEQEHALVLRGVRQVGSQVLKMANSPTYTEVRIQPFTPEEVRRFLTGYFKYHHDEEFSQQRVKELDRQHNDNLLSRPVHARMLAELATDKNFVIGKLSQFELYDHFVKLLIEREQAKPGRGNLLKTVDRRAFSCDVAWHLWIQPTGAAVGCRADDLPSDLFTPYIPSGEDPTTTRRALLSGSFLDEKAGGVFFFAHRSFQEFLVAEYIYDYIEDPAEGREIIIFLPIALSQEVFDFLIERDDYQFFKQLLSQLSRMNASLPLSTFYILVSSKQLGIAAVERQGGSFSAWAACLWMGRLLMHEEMTDGYVIDAVRNIARRAAHMPGVLMAALRTLLLIRPDGLEDITIAKCAIVLMYARAQQDIDALQSDGGFGRKSRGSLLRDAIFEAVSAELSADGRLIMTLDTAELFAAIDGAQQPIHADERPWENLIVHSPFDDLFEPLPEISQRRLMEFYKNDAQVNATIRRPPED